MKENLSSLWSPDEELKERSNLNRFCKILSKNKYLEYDQIFTNFGNGQLIIRKFFGQKFGTSHKLKELKVKKY